MPQDSTINATEALYGFWDWMCQDPQKEFVGGGHHGAHLRGQLANFCEANDLPVLEDGWVDKVKYPQRSNRKAAKDFRHVQT